MPAYLYNIPLLFGEQREIEEVYDNTTITLYCVNLSKLHLDRRAWKQARPVSIVLSARINRGWSGLVVKYSSSFFTSPERRNETNVEHSCWSLWCCARKVSGWSASVDTGDTVVSAGS